LLLIGELLLGVHGHLLPTTVEVPLEKEDDGELYDCQYTRYCWCVLEKSIWEAFSTILKVENE